MAQFQAFDPNVEVSGDSVLLLVDTLGMFKRLAIKILANHGISDVSGGTWYSQQAYLNAYQEIFEKVGERTIKTIGKQVPNKVPWPPNIDSVQAALESIDVAYHINNRNGNPGSYRYESSGERSGKMVCHNPYPCIFDMGLIEAVGNKFAPAGTMVRVTHDTPENCRAKSGDICTYSISW